MLMGGKSRPALAALEQGIFPVPVSNSLSSKKAAPLGEVTKEETSSLQPALPAMQTFEKTEEIKEIEEKEPSSGFSLIEKVEQKRVDSFSVANIGFEKTLPPDLFEKADFELVSFLTKELSKVSTPRPFQRVLAHVLGTQTEGFSLSGDVPAEDFFLFRVRTLFETGFYEEALSMLSQIPVQKQTGKMQELSLNLLFLTKGSFGACREFSAYSKAGQTFLQAQAVCFRAQKKEEQAELSLNLLAEEPAADKGFLFLAKQAVLGDSKEDLKVSSQEAAEYLTADKIRPLYFFISGGRAFPVLIKTEEEVPFWLLKEMAARGNIKDRIAALELSASDSEQLRNLYLMTGRGLTLDDVDISFTGDKNPSFEKSPFGDRYEKEIVRRSVLISQVCETDKASDKIKYATLLTNEAREKGILKSVLPALAPCVQNLTAGPVSEKILFNAFLGFLLDGKEKEMSELFFRVSQGKFPASKGLAHSLAPFRAAVSVLKKTLKEDSSAKKEKTQPTEPESFLPQEWLRVCRTGKKEFLLACETDKLDSWLSFWLGASFADKTQVLEATDSVLSEEVKNMPPYYRLSPSVAVTQKLTRSRLAYQKAEMILLAMYLMKNSALFEEEAVQSLAVFGFEKEAVQAFIQEKALRSVQ